MKKIKIRVPITPVESDPPPVKCDVCGAITDYWQIFHKGKKKMCLRHAYRNQCVPAEHRYKLDWRDLRQINAAHSIIGVIKDVRK